MVNGTYLVTGIILGLSGGLTPGPLLTLVITETLKHGFREGAKVSLAPLLTDLPIVAAAVVLLHCLADIRPLLGV
ncbi:MAG: LysE family translocator, partial [Desulfobacterales bacterium]